MDISELNKESGEKQNLFENKTSVFQIKIDELEKSLAKQIKENFDLLIKIDNLENVFADEEKRATLGKLNAFDNENCDFESKVIHLEKIIAQKSKDFDDVNLELSNRTAKFEAYFEKLEKNRTYVLERKFGIKGKRVETKLDNSLILGKPLLLNNERDQLLKQISYLESKLASQDIHSCQKEYHELRTSYNALKVKFDSLNRKKWNINVLKSSKPKESVSKRYHAIPPPYTGNFMPPKPNLVLADEEEYVFSELITSLPVVATSKVKTSESKPKSVSEPLIENWISNSEDENETEFKSKQRKPSFAKVEFVKSNEHMKIPRESVEKVEKQSKS
ncbi:hypothetical protein Tco_0916601 [Tanacetum coccineum]